ncbi:MAG: ubiquitin-activating E1 FCCH domain-containing protein [Bacteroidia bacterium]|jgi:hypothetical protein
MSDALPIIIGPEGVTPQSPADVRTALTQIVAAEVPGYTNDLPGSLIEDIASTDVAAVLLADQARIDLLNSLTPRGANGFLTRQLGAIYGVPLGVASTTSVLVVFSGTPNYVVQPGFTVTDGTYQYVCTRGTVIGSSGDSPNAFCLATTQGSWAVPPNTVNQLATSLPAAVTLTVNNPTAGTPGGTEQTEAEYRAQVIQAGRAVSQGMPSALRAALQLVSGVQARLIGIRQLSNQWEIIVGGGDPYEVALAIFQGLFDISDLTGSTMVVTDITKATHGVVTTELNHGYIVGDSVTFEDVVGMTEVNGNTYAVFAVIDEKTFSINVNTTGFTTYTSGGVLTPNLRNQLVSLVDYPDTYEIAYVAPPLQTVTMTVTWNTTATNIVSPVAVAQLAIPALVAYVNSVFVGQPMNLFELQATFQEAVAAVIPTAQLTRMVFAVSINGIGTAPQAGTGIIEGDPESYFFAEDTGITVTQG